MKPTVFSLLAGVLALAFILSSAAPRSQAPTPSGMSPGSAMPALIGGGTPITSLPFTIDECGRYFLTRCLTGVSGSNGITIQNGVDDVTLDLNGFSLIGVPGSLTGIALPGSNQSVTIHNGSVRGWDQDGIGMSQTVTGLLLDGLHVTASADDGILLGGGVRVRDCTVESNGGDGIFAFGCEAAVISGCIVRLNGDVGVRVDGGDVTIRSSSLSDNTTNGIELTKGGIVLDCAVNDNGHNGIEAGNGDGVLIRSCGANNNGNKGIEVGDDAHIVDNVASNNLSHGIQVNSRCTVRGNTCNGNAGSGIRLKLNDNLIADNTLIDNQNAIHVELTDNLIFGNAASGSGYVFPSGNAYGPIVNVGGAGDYSGVANADHPDANLFY